MKNEEKLAKDQTIIEEDVKDDADVIGMPSTLNLSQAMNLFQQKNIQAFKDKNNPRVGLITLATDFNIEKDFNEIIDHKKIDLYCNRIHSYNPLTNENLKKMANDIPKITKNISK